MYSTSKSIFFNHQVATDILFLSFCFCCASFVLPLQRGANAAGSPPLRTVVLPRLLFLKFCWYPAYPCITKSKKGLSLPARHCVDCCQSRWIAEDWQHWCRWQNPKEWQVQTPPLGLGGDPSIRYVSFFSASSYSTEPAAGDAAGLRCNLRSDACWQVMSAGRKAL